MELRQLRYFAAVAEEGGFVRAAERLGIAQPALSRQIRSLERELGTPLLDRLPRGAQLTLAGQTLLRHVRFVLARLEQARVATGRAAQSSAGLIRVGFNEIAMFNSAVQKAILAHRRRYPGVELELLRMTSPEQQRAFRRDEIDVGLMFGVPEKMPELLFRRIAVYGMVLALPRGHRFARRRSLKLADLDDEPFVWLARRKYEWVHRQLMDICLNHGLAPRIVQEAVGQEAMLALIAQGLGIGFMHSSVIAQKRPGLIFKSAVDLDAPQPLYLVRRRKGTPRIVNRFCELTMRGVEIGEAT